MNQVSPQFTRPVPPRFDSGTEEREHRKQRLVAAFRIFSDLGYDQGIQGHISFRDPEEPTHIWMNPFAVHFALISTQDLIRISFDGRIIEGAGHIHPTGWLLHSRLYMGQARVNAIAHAHSIYGRVWSTTGRLLDPISPESAQFYKRHDLYDSFDKGEGEQVGHTLGAHRALIMKNHGILSAGDSVDEAAYSFIALERVCEAQVLAEATRTGPVRIAEHHALAASERFTPDSAWLNFQPLYAKALRDYPEIAW